MATIINELTGETVILNSLHMVGRSPGLANTLLQQPDVSSTHATIFYQGNRWFLKDHSRNGTLLSGEYLKHCTKKLVKTDWFQFGKDELTRWRIVDLEAPCSYLKPLEAGQPVIKLTSCHALPDETSPEATIYRSRNKKWYVEKSEGDTCLANGDKISLSNAAWVFIQNDVLEETRDMGNYFKDSYFVFLLSRDEEHINLQLVLSNEHAFDLGSRSFHYVLLALARKRRADHELGIAFEDQGWVYTEDLIKDVSKEVGRPVDIYYLNLQIFRIREQLSELNQHGYFSCELVQRRLGALRFSYPNFKIVKSLQSKAEILTV